MNQNTRYALEEVPGYVLLGFAYMLVAVISPVAVAVRVCRCCLRRVESGGGICQSQPQAMP